MRFVRYRRGGAPRYGILAGDDVAELTCPPFDPTYRRTGRVLPVTRLRLLSPVAPAKVIGVGANSGADIPEVPILFLKPSTTVVGPGEAIAVPPDVGRVDYEGELAVVIGQRCRNIRPNDVPGVVLGYTCANDVTARDLQRGEPQWTRAKGFDTFTPLGPWIDTTVDPGDLVLQTRVNGRLRQDTRTSLLARQVAAIVSFASTFMTLQPGDVFLMGASGEVGPIVPGDQVDVFVDHIGSLKNPVIAGDGATANHPQRLPAETLSASNGWSSPGMSQNPLEGGSGAP